MGGQQGSPKRHSQRSGQGGLRNLWQNMFRNNAEGDSSAESNPGYQVSALCPPCIPKCISNSPLAYSTPPLSHTCSGKGITYL